ncbi:MAG TPA: LCCL domain-containing protein [Gemmata sp.]|nr:LCCL domain-containing protein [Gemmata sp.]
MPVTRLLVSVAPAALTAAVFLTSAHYTAAAPDPVPTEPARTTSGVEAEIKCIDESSLKIKLLDDKLEMVTKYGYLQIPVADIRRIEFAHRCPADVGEKIAVAISKLGHPDFQTRERATADLKTYRERAYPFLLRNLKHDDPEVSRRADEAAKFIQARVPAAQLEVKDTDVVYTEDSKFAGKLSALSLRVNTLQFGEQQLKLADIRSLRSASGTATEDLLATGAAPTNLMTYQQQFGKELVFNVIGFVSSNGQQPSLWGTDLYSLDSNFAAAVVHAGLAKPGESATVRVRVVQSPQQFFGSFRNGISSTAYASYSAGAFEFLRK